MRPPRLGDGASVTDGLSAARICPFDPSFPVFVELCRIIPDKPYLPRIDLDLPLEDDGQATLMEFCMPAPADTVTRIRRSWDGGDDEALPRLRHEAGKLNSHAATTMRWWDGFDLNDGNIMVSASGRTVLVDLYCMDGHAMFHSLEHDPVALAREMPVSKRRYMADIGYIGRSCGPDEIAAIHAAVAAANRLG